jgi:hypothetical protein
MIKFNLGKTFSLSATQVAEMTQQMAGYTGQAADFVVQLDDEYGQSPYFDFVLGRFAAPATREAGTPAAPALVENVRNIRTFVLLAQGTEWLRGERNSPGESFRCASEFNWGFYPGWVKPEPEPAPATTGAKRWRKPAPV